MYVSGHLQKTVNGDKFVVVMIESLSKLARAVLETKTIK